MRSIVLGLLAVLPLAAHACCEAWSFVRSVGGIAVEEPRQIEGSWSLPIRANVSGLETITEKPTALNSALGCKATHAAVERNNIYLTLETSLPTKKINATCPAASLGRIAPGTYTVFYRGPGEPPILLREVHIGL